MAQKRKNISKSVRFEVFKRDSFTCQYCGRSAPDVVLEIDHIIPVSKGGENEITNLITSCFDCNRGKGRKKLTENQTVKLQKEELDKLNKRREQLEMIGKWKVELMNVEQEEINKIIELVNLEHHLDISLTDTGRKNMNKLIKSYGFNEILESSLISFGKYEPEIAFRKIAAIAKNRKLDKEEPKLKEIYYIRGIVKNRFTYCDLNRAFKLIKGCYDKGASFESLKSVALECKSWSHWVDTLERFLISNSKEV